MPYLKRHGIILVLNTATLNSIIGNFKRTISSNTLYNSDLYVRRNEHF